LARGFDPRRLVTELNARAPDGRLALRQTRLTAASVVLTRKVSDSSR
jgi:hypothetical protein